MTYGARGLARVQTVDTQAVVAWREQVLVFNNATLATVVDEINRYRPGMLVLLNRELGPAAGAGAVQSCSNCGRGVVDSGCLWG